MRSEEVERLLGGYATSTLTDSERKVLFDAALDDQELFNALEDEEALRDLLSDTESRREIVRALKQVRRRPSRPWVWRVAGSLAAACALVFVLFRSNEPPRPKTIASNQVANKQPVEQVLENRAAQEFRQPRAAISSPLASKRKPLQKLEMPKQVMADATPALAGAPPMVAKAITVSIRADLPVTILRGQTILKPGDLIEAGDRIQFRLQSPVSGSLTLSIRDVPGPTLTVTAGQEYTIPQVPITVETASTFRLTLTSLNGLVQVSEISLVPGKPR